MQFAAGAEGATDALHHYLEPLPGDRGAEECPEEAPPSVRAAYQHDGQWTYRATGAIPVRAEIYAVGHLDQYVTLHDERRPTVAGQAESAVDELAEDSHGSLRFRAARSWRCYGDMLIPGVGKRYENFASINVSVAR